MQGQSLGQIVGDGLAAMRVASDRPELWLPGALAWITVFGWLPLALTVAPPVDQADLTFFGAGLATSAAWPWNAVALGAGLVLAAAIALTLGALGQAALHAALRRGAAERSAVEVWRDTWRVLGARLLAAVPGLVAAVVVIAAVVAVAPDEFQSPDIGGQVAARIAGRVLPILILLGLASFVGFTIAAAVERRAIGPHGSGLPTAVRTGLRDLGRAPVGTAVVSLVGLAGRLVYLGAAYLLLRTLWAPIGARLAGGSGIDAAAALLLVGFIAIWLCLVLGGGVVHAWISAWWTLQLAAARAGQADRSGRSATVEGTRSA